MRKVVLAILILIALQPDISHAQQTAAFNDSLRVLSWNIFMISPTAPRQKHRSDAIAKKLAKGEFDVIVLQEAFRPSLIRRMNKHLDSMYPHQLLPGRKHGIYSSGVWILSKHPIIESETIRFKEKRHFDRFADKGAVQARIKKGEFQLDVIGTHTQAMGKPKHFDTREAQFNQIKMELLKKDRIPDLIIGDLNTPKEPAERYMHMLEILGAEDGAVVMPENQEVSDTVCYTWGCVYNDLTPKKFKGRTYQFDYALVRKNGQQLAMERKLRIDKGTNRDGEYNLSDHYAIDVLIKY